ALERYLTSFREGMRQLGYVEGGNVHFEFRFADGYLDRLPDPFHGAPMPVPCKGLGSGQRTSLPSRPPASRRRCALATSSRPSRSATRGWMARVANRPKSRFRSSLTQAGCSARIRLME